MVVHNSLTRLEGLIPIVLPIQHVEFTEANDIEQTGSVQIAKKFEVSLDMPPAALYLKSATASLAGVEGSSTVVEGDNHADVTESYDISSSSIPDIGYVLDASAANIVGKVPDGLRRILEGIITIVERD